MNACASLGVAKAVQHATDDASRRHLRGALAFENCIWAIVDTCRSFRDSPLRQHIETFKICGDLGLLASLAPLAKFTELRLIDLEEATGGLPADVARQLRENGKTVLCSAVWTDARSDGEALKLIERK